VIVATLSCLALVACGGDDGEGGGGSDLVSRLPGDARAVSVVDLTEVTKRLGLPEDANPTKPPGDDGAELTQARLFGYAGDSFPYLVRLEQPLTEAIDETRVTATASTPVSGPDSVTVLATDQPFDEIAERLEAGDYEDRDGGRCAATA
jgi:hypothetical protein